ncbi:putative H4MPT-linked C1 transfer pathway protein [Angulomicrobium tetraedrale]|uniref:Putative H4MPT-linked C1 transfer pathway protein n=1 Tax=Ancylobacter tetraedralis TaxID=217068 RepID=A0A839Z2J5_9HYPH|nr:hydantoinase/oxoprolinase family protein [Ancylobacter tetraedralis]MBB3769839.1 putative H4MPT-linked C1 transfer pathway protein [Ancylobacter tetraedralis]
MTSETLRNVVRLGWDVGGAHVKLAAFGRDGRLKAVRIAACPVWKGATHLHEAIRTLRAEFPGDAASAVTMTAEVADLWPDRRAGVVGTAAILIEELGTAPLALFAGPEGFVPATEAAAHADMIGSANWYATAAVLAHLLPGGVLIDIGSTTSDLIPFSASRVAARGFTDAQRLANNELVYAGVVRTPVMALAEAAPWGGRWLPLMAEHYATTADVHRLTGELSEMADLHPSADGGAKSEEASARRLLRMVGQDFTPQVLPAARALARYFAEEQLHRLSRAFDGVASAGPEETDLIVGAGVGRFLAARLAERRNLAYLDLAQVLTDDENLAREAADCAPAVAVGLLAAALTED